MKEKILLKKDNTINDGIAGRKWSKGEMIGVVTTADNVGYALIKTEHNEFDLAHFTAIKPYNNWFRIKLKQIYNILKGE